MQENAAVPGSGMSYSLPLMNDFLNMQNCLLESLFLELYNHILALGNGRIS